MEVWLDAGADRVTQFNLVFSSSHAGTAYHFSCFVFDMRLRLRKKLSSPVLRFPAMEPFGLQAPRQHQFSSPGLIVARRLFAIPTASVSPR
jgi:hypothetical protein